jgi:hypothetical protein
LSELTIEVKNKPIQSLILTEVKSGKYLLPSFQRQWQWDEDDIKKFIDSIINNYPIGAIILWKPSNVSASEIDPFSKPLIDVKDKKHTEVFYVIDGQQRLTSLLLLFNDWTIKRDGEDIVCETPISYNPANKKFYKSKTRGINLSKLVRAFCLQDLTALTDLANNVPREHFDEMKEKTRKILDYVVPFYIMQTYDENEQTFKRMAEAFIRVNKFGVRIGNLELMLSFLAGSISGELKQQIRDLYEDLFRKFEIDLQPIIRFTFSNFGLKQTQISKVEQFKRNITTISTFDPNEMKQIFDRCSTALKLTVNFLKKELGIGNSILLPSQTPIIPLAAYFFAMNLTALDELNYEESKRIVDWFVLASFTGYYSSQTDTKLDRDLEVINQASSFPWDSLLANMQAKKAKTKISFNDIKRGLNYNVLRVQGRAHLFLLYVLLSRRNADDWNGVVINRRSQKDLARHHIFPYEFLEQNLNLDEPETKEFLINTIANITFIHKDINSEIEDTPPDKYLSDYINSAKNHFISTDKELWKLEQYQTFLDYRIKQIYLAAKGLFGALFEQS